MTCILACNFKIKPHHTKVSPPRVLWFHKQFHKQSHLFDATTIILSNRLRNGAVVVGLLKPRIFIRVLVPRKNDRECVGLGFSRVFISMCLLLLWYFLWPLCIRSLRWGWYLGISLVICSPCFVDYHYTVGHPSVVSWSDNSDEPQLVNP